MFVDSNHTGNKPTRRSMIGFMINTNMLLINWYSNKQSTIETSVLGVDFVTIKVGVNILHAT